MAIAEESPSGRAGKRAGPLMRVEWDLLLWMFGSFAVLYFTDFASHLLFNPVVKMYAVILWCVLH